MQVRNDVEADRGSHHPVGARLHGRAGVGVDHHGAIGMRVAKRAEFVHRAAQIQRAGCVQIGHQNAFARAQNLGGLAHEAHAGHHQRLRRMIAAEARHFQRVRHAAAGFLGQVLQIGVNIIMRHQHRSGFLQQLPRAFLENDALLRRRRGRHARPCVRRAAAALGGPFEFDGFERGRQRRFNTGLSDSLGGHDEMSDEKTIRCPGCSDNPRSCPGSPQFHFPSLPEYAWPARKRIRGRAIRRSACRHIFPTRC